MKQPFRDYLTPLQDGSRDRPLFADGFPLMLVSQASLASLNTKLGAAGSKLVVEETRFRPNILISGNFEGFQEDRSVDCFLIPKRWHKKYMFGH